MQSLACKSTGTLIDEWLTATIKAGKMPKEENIIRRDNLFRLVVEDRLGGDLTKVADQITSLYKTLQECWDAQENIMFFKQYFPAQMDPTDYNKLGHAAITAQETNAQRNKLIREIDTILGEAEFTQLEKTYA